MSMRTSPTPHAAHPRQRHRTNLSILKQRGVVAIGYHPSFTALILEARQIWG